MDWTGRNLTFFYLYHKRLKDCTFLHGMLPFNNFLVLRAVFKILDVRDSFGGRLHLKKGGKLFYFISVLFIRVQSSLTPGFVSKVAAVASSR